jgi:hypothetical protein
VFAQALSAVKIIQVVQNDVQKAVASAFAKVTRKIPFTLSLSGHSCTTHFSNVSNFDSNALQLRFPGGTRSM